MKDEDEDGGFIFIPPCFVVRRGRSLLPTSGSAEGDMWAMKMTAWTIGGGFLLVCIVVSIFALVRGC